MLIGGHYVNLTALSIEFLKSWSNTYDTLVVPVIGASSDARDCYVAAGVQPKYIHSGHAFAEVVRKLENLLMKRKEEQSLLPTLLIIEAGVSPANVLGNLDFLYLWANARDFRLTILLLVNEATQPLCALKYPLWTKDYDDFIRLLRTCSSRADLVTTSHFHFPPDVFYSICRKKYRRLTQEFKLWVLQHRNCMSVRDLTKPWVQLNK